jgi:hypothetical protein
VIQFKQSLYDFPCPVALGNNTPSFSLHRYKKGLRFIPPDDDGFVLRGDRRRLLYKGRRRSHRITILGDSAFEYDCILHKEPDTNVITLRMEGAEHYDFFRQPDFVKDPFLKGSYAVYKKTTLMGEGTGKLCHIHRPLIIDALGRRCWGELAVVGNVLCITIPEQWLAMAKYPVVVDPTVGTSTVGSQYEYFDTDDNCWLPYIFADAVGTNRYIVPETMSGTATVYCYFQKYKFRGNNSYYSYNAHVYPIIYSDVNNTPYARLTQNEVEFNFPYSSSETQCWRTSSFTTNQIIKGGSYIWFGVFCGDYHPRFDYYNEKCFIYYHDIYEYENKPDIFPLECEGIDTDYRSNKIKMSMYFTYIGAQNFIRTLTQGVRLTDSPKLKAAYQRNIQHTAGVHSLLNGFAALYRSIQETIQGIDNQISSVVFVRSLSETLNVYGIVNHIGEFYRGLFDDIQVDGEVKSGRFFAAKIIDTVHTVGVVFRGLTLLVRIITKVVVRDYLLSRFLKAREELILKSCITRVLTIDSRIN